MRAQGSLLAIVAVAANLRPSITVVGPVIGLIGADLALGPGTLGVLGAAPLVAFAVVSPLVHVPVRRWGADRVVFVATLALVLATLLRSLPGGQLTLWAGTALLGASIGVVNVAVPAIVKQEFATDVPLVTGVYSAVLSGSAAVASGLSVPIADRYGWRTALAVWGLLSVIAALVWLPRVLRAGGGRDRRPTRPVAGAELPLPAPPRGPSMWSSPVAWQVTAFMATQATTFYLLVTWLPSIEVSRGVSPATAGWHLFLYQLVGIPAGLAVTLFMRRRADHRLVGAAVSILVLVAAAGLLLAPSWLLVWVVLAGLGGGSSLVVALALVGERVRTSAAAAQLSGMVQSIGYLLAVAGPIGAGLLFRWTATWSSALVAVGAVAALQLGVAFLAGRPRFTHAEPPALVGLDRR